MRTVNLIVSGRGVAPGGAPPDFGRSVNPISTRGDRLCPPNHYWHPQFSDLLMALRSNPEDYLLSNLPEQNHHFLAV